jgi:hypothetical protein
MVITGANPANPAVPAIGELKKGPALPILIFDVNPNRPWEARQ